MRRVGFKMKLHPGRAAEYKKRHDESWPELAELLAARGIRDYTIFHDPETDILFAINPETGKAHMKFDECWYCLACEIDCPRDAITVQIPYLLR